MTTFATEFLGCKVSMVDAQQIRERLAADGHGERAPELAEVRVVNTCCVTAEAVAKSRKAVRRAARTAERVFVTGCAAALPGAFADLAGSVEVVGARSDHPNARAERVGVDHVPLSKAERNIMRGDVQRAGRVVDVQEHAAIGNSGNEGRTLGHHSPVFQRFKLELTPLTFTVHKQPILVAVF